MPRNIQASPLFEAKASKLPPRFQELWAGCESNNKREDILNATPFPNLKLCKSPSAIKSTTTTTK